MLFGTVLFTLLLTLASSCTRDCVGKCRSYQTLGDGTCDEGAGSSQFQCAAFSFDFGDCEKVESTCQSSCGGISVSGSCFCDEYCSLMGDCCSDFNQQCRVRSSTTTVPCPRGNFAVRTPTGQLFDTACDALQAGFFFFWAEVSYGGSCNIIDESMTLAAYCPSVQVYSDSAYTSAMTGAMYLFRKSELYNLALAHSRTCGNVVGNIICDASFGLCGDQAFSTCSNQCLQLAAACGREFAEVMFECDLQCSEANYVIESSSNVDPPINASSITGIILGTCVMLALFVASLMIACTVMRKRKRARLSDGEEADKLATASMASDTEDNAIPMEEVTTSSPSSSSPSKLFLFVQQGMSTSGYNVCLHLDGHGLGVLHYAAVTGDVSCLNYVLHNVPSNVPSPVNILDFFHKTPLMWAAEYSQTCSIQILLQHGANPSLLSKTQETALHLACKSDAPSAVVVATLLLERKLDINQGDGEGATPLLRAVAAGNLPLVKFLVNHGAHLNCRDDTLTTPLITAIRYRHNALVEYILPQVDLDHADVNGWTALHWACACNNVYAVEQMLKPGRSYIIRNLRTNNAESCVHLAVRERHLQLVKMLINLKCKTNSEDMYGRTPLDLAHELDLEEIADILSSTTSVSTADLHTSSVDEVSSQGDDDSSFDSSKYASPPSIVADGSTTPIEGTYSFNIIPKHLLSLAENSDEKIIDDFKSELSQLGGNLDSSIFYFVVMSSPLAPKLLEELLRVCPMPSDAGFSTNRQSLLHLLCQRDDLGGSALSLIDLLLTHQPDLLDLQDANGATPLQYACSSGNQLLVEKLISAGASFKSDNSGSSPLMTAVRLSHNHLIPLLIDHSNLRRADINGWTAMHWAAAIGNIDALKAMLAFVDQNEQSVFVPYLDCRTNTGETPLLLARRENHGLVQKYLLSQQ